MGKTLWVTNDTHSQERANRNAFLERLYAPIHDTDRYGTETVIPVSAQVSLGSSIGDIWSVPAGIAAAVVTSITIVNTDSSARTVSLYMIEPGETAASVARSILNTVTFEAGQRMTIRVPYILAAEATIRGLASAANVVGVTVNALTFDEQPGGLNLLVLEGVALSDSLSTLYTAGTTGMASPSQAIVFAATLCNTDGSARVPEMHFVASGDAAAVENQVWKQSQLAQQTAWLEGLESLADGDFIQAKASTASVVGTRLSIVEIE